MVVDTRSVAHGLQGGSRRGVGLLQRREVYLIGTGFRDVQGVRDRACKGFRSIIFKGSLIRAYAV